MTHAPAIPPAPPPASYDWAETFRAFTPQHLLVAGICIAFMAALCAIGRSLNRRHERGERSAGMTERSLRIGWSLSIVLWQTLAVVWWLLPANFDLAESLPLHLCDLAAWVAPLALLTRNRWLRAMLYFWGIGLSTQAFFTPVLAEGYSDARFWMFWVGHTQIVGSAVYDVVVGGFRPRLSDLGRAIVAGVLYSGSMFAFDAALGLNYGYVGPTRPEARTIIDALGKWPVRALWLVLIAIAAQSIAWVPWGVAGLIGERCAKQPAQPRGSQPEPTNG